MKFSPKYFIYPGGMIMPGRFSTSGDYRYGYNGMEMDNETSGNGNSYTTEFRQYDPRLMRWKSLDPNKFKYPSMSPYVAFNNNAIYFIDKLGLDGEPLNVLIIILGQDEINDNIINSGEHYEAFKLIIATDVESAATELKKLSKDDGQCIENLAIIAHCGPVAGEESGRRGIYYSPTEENKTDQYVSGTEFEEYVKNGTKFLAESAVIDIEALEYMLSEVAPNGTALIWSCNVGDDALILVSIPKLIGTNDVRFYFNSDKCVYSYSDDTKSFILEKTLTITSKDDFMKDGGKGWIIWDQSFVNKLKYLYQMDFNYTGNITLDFSVTEGKFVNPELKIDINGGNNEMEDNTSN